MPRTVTTTRYQFDELSPDVKEAARDWWRSFIAEDNDWGESVIEYVVNIADLLGVNLRQRRVQLMSGLHRMEPQIYWSLDRDGGVGFDASYQYVAGSAAKLRQHAPQDEQLHKIADQLQRIQRRHCYKLTAAVRAVGRDGLSLQVDVDNDGSRVDPGAWDAACVEVESAICDFAHWIYRQLEREIDYHMSAEAVDENLRANEYEFDENGAMSLRWLRDPSGAAVSAVAVGIGVCYCCSRPLLAGSAHQHCSTCASGECAECRTVDADGIAGSPFAWCVEERCYWCAGYGYRVDGWCQEHTCDRCAGTGAVDPATSREAFYRTRRMQASRTRRMRRMQAIRPLSHFSPAGE